MNLDLVHLRRAFCWALWAGSEADNRPGRWPDFDRIPEGIADLPASERRAATERAVDWAYQPHPRRGLSDEQSRLYNAARRLRDGFRGIERPLNILDECIEQGRLVASVRFAGGPGVIHHCWHERRLRHLGAQYPSTIVEFADDRGAVYAIPQGMYHLRPLVEYMHWRKESP